MTSSANENARRWAAPAAPPSPEELSHRYAVAELAKIYALGVDVRDYELCRSVFAAGAQAEGLGGVLAPIDVYLPRIFAAASAFQATQHNIANQYVSVNGDEAVAWSYAVAFHKPAPGDRRASITVGVQYRDRCRRYAEGWLITERRGVIQWTERAAPKDAGGAV